MLAVRVGGVLVCLLRSGFKDTFSIKPEKEMCCGGCLEDCVMGFCCFCCQLAQMDRHLSAYPVSVSAASFF